MAFIHDDFLLQNRAAVRLYHTYAEEPAIFDYHNHLPPADIAANKRFKNLFEIWLAGDHYKWRAMRANGVDERLITGEAEPYDKFLAWAKTVPHTLRNPLYHWTHLELKRYFGIDELLNEDSAPSIWKRTSEMLQSADLTTHGILRRFNVAALCTTDDPVNDLSHHIAIGKSNLATRVYPAFRPDKAMAVDQPAAFNAWVSKLSEVSNTEISNLSDFLSAIGKRHQFFHEQGCRLSDHGLANAFADFPTETMASEIFKKARGGQAASKAEHAQFASYLMLHLGHLDTERGWTKQLHLGALRNNNPKAVQKLGPDTGFDSIGDYPQAQSLGAYLDRLSSENALPKMILYNNNPVDNYVLATMIGNYQDGTVPGKMQFGSGWWFLDAKEGIEWQVNALSNCGLLSRFVGMLTDSRSFMSYPRHEYFRRVLCNMIGREMESGEIPNDEEMVGKMISDICFQNAKNYFDLETAASVHAQ